MPNWYQKTRGVESHTSRYIGTMTANIVIPSQNNQEKDIEVARYVLEKYLPESSDASSRTAIESTVNIQILGVSPYDELV